MSNRTLVVALVVSLLSTAAVSPRAQEPKEGEESKCVGGPPGSKCGPTSITFPFKEEIDKKKIASELKCLNGKKKNGKLVYEKCKHKTFQDFDEVAVKLKLVTEKEKLRSLSKEKLKRAKQLAALRSAKKSLKLALKESMDKGAKSDAEQKVAEKLEAADDKIKDDIKKAVAACKEKDSAEMNCDAKFPEED